jgi:pimeloyl-ACP methyl ester carboxylesterase
MPTAVINGAEIAYTDSALDHGALDHGALDHGGDAPVVLLSHGFLMDHTMFDPQLPALTPEFRVITWDQRGFGRTRTPGPFTFWDSARDALGLLDHLGVAQAVFGGMSQGGFLSLRAALLAPDRVAALILIDTQAGLEDPAAADSYEQLEQIWLDQGPAPVQELVAAIILGAGQWDDWFAKWAALDPSQLTLAFRCLMDRDDITGRLGEITCPALVLHGTADAAIPLARAEALRDGLGGPARLLPVEGAGHASSLTGAGQVNPALLGFLRSGQGTLADFTRG